MLLLLDAHDLVMMAQRGEPLSSQRVGSWLREHDGYLVLSGTSVVEAAVPLLQRGASKELDAVFEEIEMLPLRYLKEMAIIVDELSGALVAFGRGREPLSFEPFVPRWSDTLGISLGKSYAARGIVQAVSHLWKTSPEALGHFHHYQEILAEGMWAEPLEPSADIPSGRLCLRLFARYVGRQLRMHGFTLPPHRMEDFAEWLYLDPRRCTGLRFSFEVHKTILSETQNGVGPGMGRLSGLGHIHATPYVDAISLKPPLLECCQTVGREWEKQNVSVPYASRVYPDLGAILLRWQ